MKKWVAIWIYGFSITAFSQSGLFFQVTKDNPRELVVDVRVNLPSFKEKKTPYGTFTAFELKDLAYVLVGDTGEPALPAITRLLQLPEKGSYRVEVIQSSYKDYVLSSLGISSPLYPYQPSVPKTGKVPFYYKKDAYQKKSFIFNKVSEIQYIGKMRSFALGKLFIYPFDYLPSKNILRIFHSLQIKVVFDQAIDHSMKEPLFDWVNNLLINPSSCSIKDELTRSPIKMVIVADSMFKATLQAFIQWKRKEGYKVIEAYRGTPNVGSSATSIKAYLKSLYDSATAQDPAPSYVLLVGDVAQMPPFTGTTGSHVTDLYYVEYTGDILPDAYVGRFSAQDTTQLKNILNKTLEYEQYLFPTDTWLDTVVLIAGNDDTYGPIHGNGQINYAHNVYFNSSQGLYPYVHLYPQTVSDTTIRAEIGKGCSFANYTAHGSPSGWASPSFSVSDIPSMNNAHKYPVMIGNACLTNKFDENECFGEALIRAANKGAVAYIGGSNTTYWDEDYYWSVGYRSTITANPTYDSTALGMYDRLWHFSLPYSEWFMSVSQMILAGNLAVLQGSNMINYYSEIYHVMGDPSLMPYIGRPVPLVVNHQPFYPYGLTQITISTEPYAYIGCTQNGQFLAAGFADANGNLTLTFETTPDSGYVDIVGTKQFRKPYIGQFYIGNPNGPYVYFKQVQSVELSGHVNNFLEYGEDFGFSMILKNYGQKNDTGVFVQCHIASPYIQALDSIFSCGIIVSGDSVNIPVAFRYSIQPVIPPLVNVPCTLTIKDTFNNTWNYVTNLTLKAPKLKIMGVQIEDANNHRIDPGETVTLRTFVKNIGNSTIRNIDVVAQNMSSDLTFSSTSSLIDSLLPGQLKSVSYPVTANTQTPLYTLANVLFKAQSSGYKDSLIFKTWIGVLMEDFETHDFSKFDWAFNSVPWTITNAVVYEGTCAARSGNITHDQKTQLQITLDVLSGDTLYFYKKVSSEESYDFLVFYLDNQPLNEWSGEIDWSPEKFYIPTGQHTLVWSYEKDYAVSNGMDAAFIDDVIFPPLHIVTNISASQNESIENIFPNPASQHIMLSEHLYPAQLNFYSMDGKLVKTLYADKSLINITDLSTGLYLLQVKSNHGIYTFKVSIKKQ